ncbi:MAG: hypothetical protein QHH13_07740 [Melioribacter sp.]|uniref:hypothetical protein n=1 Tax=Rosettibacter primus TaxID=3111523 RepID=UPI00247DCE07|nr:hypothetical protein [Melioribacter sp.]
MDFSKIIKYIEANLHNLSHAYYEQIKQSEFTKSYQQFDELKVIERAEKVFQNFIEWLKTGASNDKAEKYFENVGAERFREGFPLTEVNYALYTTKKVFWSFIAWKEELFDEMDFVQIIECTTILNNYFDLGSFYIIKGYVNELINKIDEYSKEEIKKYLIK